MFHLQASDIEHRLLVSVLCTLFRIVQDIDGVLYSLLPESRVAVRESGGTSNLNSRSFNVVGHRTEQFSRTLFMTSLNIWVVCP